MDLTSLQLDITALITEAPPQAAIAVFDTPPSCSEPVTFQSRSIDPQGLPILKDSWFSPATGKMQTGEYFELILGDGEEAVVVLTSQDQSRRTDSTSMQYRRSCS